MHYRLGLDIGANSIGWCVFSLDAKKVPRSVERMGVRIFSDGRNPKDGGTLASTRRLKRQARQRRDRYVKRRACLMQALIKHGLMPSDEESRKKLQDLPPYELRAIGLDKKLPLHHLGRAIFHLNQRRGFKSNRKATTDKKESGLIKDGIKNLAAAMAEAGARTWGEFLQQRHEQRLTVRCRLQGQGAGAVYPFYPDRALLKKEFDLLWQKQAGFHPELPPEARKEIEGILFFQRSLTSVDPGKCTFQPDEPRAPWALPLTQRFRILQDLGNLAIVGADLSQRPLRNEERDILLRRLLGQKKLSFATMKTLLGLTDGFRFNLESDKRKDLKGDETAAVLGHKDRFGKLWRGLPLEEQTRVVQWLLDPKDKKSDEDITNKLAEEFDLDREHAQRIAEAPLPRRYARLGRTAMSAIVKHMEQDYLPYFAAAARAGYHHSDMRTGEMFEELPYYGIPLKRHTMTPTTGCPDELCHGRIANPTVHIGLNQLRKLVNEMISTWGCPEQIVLEVGRKLKLSRERRREIEQEQRRNQEANERRNQDLKALDLDPSPENRLRLRLWEELHEQPNRRRCVYTGELININHLFSPEVEIDHILPFSRTLDNSTANKTVCLRHANRLKARQSPFEAFGHSPDGFDWEGILQRVAGLRKNKQWRFAPEAMERFEGKGDFLARHLTDTQYLSSAAREYLTCVCENVWVTPGRLTAMLRGKWGLNKSRDDHRYHAVDAAVIGATDRGMLQRIARAAACREEEARKVLKDLPTPWEGFRADVENCFKRIVVSHKPDHNTMTGLHNDTAYGQGLDEHGALVAVHRVVLADMVKPGKAEKIRDLALREDILKIITSTSSKPEQKKRLEEYARRTGVRRVRIAEKIKLIPVRDTAGAVYKGFKGDSNAFAEVYRQPDGKWALEVVSTFDANQGDPFATQRQRQSLPLVMRLFKNDMLALGQGEERRIYQITKFSQKPDVVLVAHNEAGDSDTRTENSFSASSLQGKGARKVSVDLLCRVKDPGARP